MPFFEFPENASWNDKRDCVEFSALSQAGPNHCAPQQGEPKGGISQPSEL